MKKLLLASTFFLASYAGANAALIATFGQTELTNTVTATVNGANTVTTFDVTNSVAAVTTFISGPIGNVYFNMDAVSIDPAVAFGPAIIQHYAGTFCFTSAIDCGGTNFLSGSFSDAAFGAAGGPGLVVNVNSPPDTLNLTSDVISASQLNSPASFNLGFTNLDPLLSIQGTTIAPFTASYAGNVSANAVATPEPASFALLGIGLLGLAYVVKRKQVGEY